MSNDKETWIVVDDYTIPPSGNFCTVLKVKKDNIALTPVAVIAAPIGWQGSGYEKEVIRKANLIAAAPEMLEALKLCLSVEAFDENTDEIYSIVESVIKKAQKETL